MGMICPGILGLAARNAGRIVKRNDGMKRWAFAILLFVLLGAIVNIAVAWGCAWASADTDWLIASPLHHLDDDDADWWRNHVGPVEDTSVWRATTAREPGVEVHYLFWVSGSRTAIAIRVWAGWPAFCLTGARWEVYERETSNLSPVSDWGQSIKALLSDVSLVEPIWPGFLLNTIFYAIIVWLLIPGPFVLRRLIRIRRGRCPKCGYDLRGQPPEAGAGAVRGPAGCPECGWNRQPEVTT